MHTRFAWCLAGSALLASLAMTRRANARCENDLVNSCVNSDLLWPKAGPNRFTFVGSSETTARDQVAFGLITSYSSRPIVVRTASPGAAGADQLAVDNVVTSTFTFAYAPSDRLSIDAMIPVTFIQNGTGPSVITGGDALPATAMRDMRFGISYALLPHERKMPVRGFTPSFGSVARMYVSAPTGDNKGFSSDRTAVFAPSLAGDLRLGPLLFAGEIGARIRPSTSLLGARIGTMLGGGLGASFDILPRDLLTLQAEGYVFYNTPEQRQLNVTPTSITETAAGGGHLVPAEWSVSARSAPFLAGDMAFTAGGGGAIPFESGTLLAPRFRFMLGIVYAPLGRDTDGDSVLDRVDRCPNDAQVRGYPPRDGCEHLTPENSETTP